MRRRELLILAASVVWLLGGAACWVLLPPSPSNRVNYTGYAAIRLGMSEEEVEAILGGPEGDYCTVEVEPAYVPYRLGCLIYAAECDRWSIWGGDHGMVAAGFDSRGKVMAVRFASVRWISPPLRMRLRLWLGIAGEGE